MTGRGSRGEMFDTGADAMSKAEPVQETHGQREGSWRYAAALAGLGFSPKRLRRLLDGWSPIEAWEALGSGSHPDDPEGRLKAAVDDRCLERASAACERAGVTVRVLGSNGYPELLSDDHEAPAVVFTTGDPDTLTRLARVAVVGTRTPTSYGLGLAKELGFCLASSGVAVVSGLAQGIDAAAHCGALRGPRNVPLVAVTGASHDAPRAPGIAAVQAEVAANGVVISEVAPGATSARWRFAVRNRIVAALAHVVVVVEAHEASGTLHTAHAADVRGIALCAFPGSVRSPASRGTNALIAAGAAACLQDIDDVFSALEIAIAGDRGVSPPKMKTTSPTPAHAPTALGGLSPVASKVLEVLDYEVASLEHIVSRCALSVGDVAMALEQLTEAGLAEEDGTCWRRRTPRRE